MENEKKYSNSYDEARKIMETGPTSDNNLQVMGWINRTKAIIKGYRDGFISDRDIKEREAFMTGSFHRENMLLSALGLLEKSSDPKAKEQISTLQHHLSILRLCRSKLTRSTPPKEVAKRIQKRQIEAKTSQTVKAVNTGATLVTGASFSDLSVGTPPSASELFLGVMLLAELKNMRVPPEYLDKLAQKPKGTPAEAFAEFEKMLRGSGVKNLSIEESQGMFISLHRSINALRTRGFTDEEIRTIMTMNFENTQDLQKIESMFNGHNLESAHIREDFHLQSGVNHANILLANIHRHDVMNNNSYDYSIVNPQQKIDGKTPEEIAAHQATLRRSKDAQLFSRLMGGRVNAQA